MSPWAPNGSGPLGDAFIEIVEMMIVPVVFCTIIVGIAGVHADRSIGKSILKAMVLFYALTIVALITGLVSVEFLQPGVGMHIDVHAIDPKEAAKYAAQAKNLDTVDVLLHIIPKSFFTPFAEGEVLPVLLIAIVAGFALRKAGAAGEPFLRGIETIGNLGLLIATLYVACGFFVFVVLWVLAPSAASA